MQTPLERVIVKSVIATAKSMGWWAMKNHGSVYSLVGLPDVLVIKDGRAAWMEVKRPNEHPTKVQVHRMGELVAAGCQCAVVRSAIEARDFLEAIA